MEDARFHISLFGRLHCRLAREREAVSGASGRSKLIKTATAGGWPLASRRRRRRRTTDSHRNESARGSQRRRRRRRRRWRRRGKRDEAIHSIDATASSGTMTTKTRRGRREEGREELRNGIRRVRQVLIRPIVRPYTNQAGQPFTAHFYPRRRKCDIVWRPVRVGPHVPRKMLILCCGMEGHHHRHPHPHLLRCQSIRLSVPLQWRKVV